MHEYFSVTNVPSQLIAIVDEPAAYDEPPVSAFLCDLVGTLIGSVHYVTARTAATLAWLLVYGCRAAVLSCRLASADV